MHAQYLPLLLSAATLARAGLYQPTTTLPANGAPKLAKLLESGPEKCNVWNHHSGDTMHFHPTTCTLLSPDSAELSAASFVEIEGLSFDVPYRTRFEQSDFSDRWRELKAGWWTRVRPDQAVRCGVEKGDGKGGEGEEEWVGCVISPRPRGKKAGEEKKDIVEEKIEEVVSNMVEAGEEEGRAREKVREEL